MIGCTKSPCKHTREEISVEEVSSDDAAPNGGTPAHQTKDDTTEDVFKMVGFVTHLNWPSL